MNNSYKHCQELLKSKLKASRYEHSLGVAEVAFSLATRFQDEFHLDVEQARLAGLLHDCGRMYEEADLIAEARARGIFIGEIEERVPLLLHASVGANIAKEYYGIKEHEILQAIERHTVGARNMTALDKIIYFADMIEPNRNYPEVIRLRDLAKSASLDDCMLAGLDASIIFVTSKGGLIHPATIAARNEILLSKG